MSQRPPRSKQRTTYAQVVKRLGDIGDYREYVLQLFKVMGGNKDRWSTADVLAMTWALTATEDMLEYMQPRCIDLRRAIKDIRRQLELETT